MHLIMNTAFYFCFAYWGGSHIMIIRSDSWLCAQRSFLVWFRVSYEASTAESMLATCNASNLPTISLTPVETAGSLTWDKSSLLSILSFLFSCHNYAKIISNCFYFLIYITTVPCLQPFFKMFHQLILFSSYSTFLPFYTQLN